MVADDTDMLILLMPHWAKNMADVYFLSEPKKSHKKGMQVWRICDLIAKAGTLVTSHLVCSTHRSQGHSSYMDGQDSTSLLPQDSTAPTHILGTPRLLLRHNPARSTTGHKDTPPIWMDRTLRLYGFNVTR